MMTNITANVRNWFAIHNGGSLLLPDGWYGRPHDNQHRLTSVSTEPGGLVLILDQKLTLRFEGQPSADTATRALVISGFSRCHFMWEGYGANARKGSREFASGEVRIVANK